MEMVLDALLDAVIDTLKLVPFLLGTYIIMEYLERRTAERQISLMEKAGWFAPVVGAAAGAVPQCGFSASAASLYSGGVVSLGTMLAVFLSTSDAMLPILLSEHAPVAGILRILAAKAVIGMATGLLVDAVLRGLKGRSGNGKDIHDLCEREHCGCEEDEEEGIIRPALTHTAHILLFVFLISFVITLIVEGLGEEAIGSFLTARPGLGILLSGLIGLIPNCAASICITKLYLEGILGMGQMMTGLLVGAGVGLLVLFRTNRPMKENVRIAGLLYICGVLWGLLIELSGF